jgi:Holliday junction resolvase
MRSINVRKESGETELFEPSKVEEAIRRAGLSANAAKDILGELEEQLYDGISTKEIYEIVFAIINRKRPESSHKYNLKRALVELGPAGYEFEDFISRLLTLEGYKTEVRQILQGKCVRHEIDVVAEKNNETYVVECKFHNSGGIKCRIQVALYTYARYLDLAEGAKLGVCRKITKPWVVCNTKFSTDVLDYAKCMNFPVLGWHYPAAKGLEALIEKRSCWPVTVIPMSKAISSRLFSRKIITVYDIPDSATRLADLAGIPLPTAKSIVEKAEYAR